SPTCPTARSRFSSSTSTSAERPASTRRVSSQRHMPEPLRKDGFVSTLIESAAPGDLDGINRALDAGTDINDQDQRGQTAVMAATYAGQVDAVRLLFNRGAAPDIQDAMLNTPFLYAGAEGLLEIAKLSYAAGADPRVTN